MDPNAIFSICNSIAFVSWLILIIFPYARLTSRFLLGVVITLFAILYSYLLFSTFEPGAFESFSTLDGVMNLFTNKMAVLAGWVHYLAFDLLAGLYIVNNAKKYNIKGWILIPSLFFTFMAGPFGLLLYFIIRAVSTKQYFQDYA